MSAKRKFIFVISSLKNLRAQTVYTSVSKNNFFYLIVAITYHSIFFYLNNQENPYVWHVFGRSNMDIINPEM